MYRDDPASSAMELLERKLFDKPFGEGVIGSKETIESMNRDQVKKVFEENYDPSNYIVVAVGDVDFDKLCKYLESNFESKGKKVERIEIKELNGEEVEERDGIDQAHFTLGIHAPKVGSPDYYALRVLDGYLANGMSSRLVLEIREKRGLAYSVKSSIDSDKDYSYYGIYVGTSKEKVEEVKRIILEELNKVRDISEKDFEESKERLIGLNKISREESINVLRGLLYSENLDMVEDFYKFESKMDEVKIEDVQRLAKELSEKEYSSAAVVPK
jgi:predicted Zn-dependent peptidase